MFLFFGNNKKKDMAEERSNKGAESALSIIAHGTTIVGNIISEGDIRVEGRIEGILYCKSKVVIGAKGRIDGNIDTINATIAGEVVGKVVVRDTLHLQESARVRGDICTVKIAIQQGAIFNGNSSTGPEAQEQIKEIAPPDFISLHKQDGNKGLLGGNKKDAAFAGNGAEKIKA